MPNNQSPYDIGLDWWNSHNAGTGEEYWDSFFQDSGLLSNLEQEYIVDPNNPYGATDFHPYNTTMFLADNPGFVSSLANFEIDPYSHYSSLETGEIQRDLLGKEFSNLTKPKESFQRGSGGLSSSGVRRRGTNIYDNFASGINSINQEESSSLDNIYSEFGNTITGLINDASNMSGGPFTPGELNSSGNTQPYQNFFNNNVESWTGYDEFLEHYNAGLPQEWFDQFSDPNSDYYMDDVPMQAIDDLHYAGTFAYTQAVESCIQDTLNPESDSYSGSESLNPSDYLSAMNQCTSSLQELGDN